MNSSPTKSRADRSPGGTGPDARRQAAELPTRPKVIFAILLAGFLSIVLILVLARTTRPPQRGGESEIAQGESPVDRGPSAEVKRNAHDSEQGAVASPSRALVDTRGQVESVAPESPLSIPEQWGIEITKVGVAAGGKALDLRYKVVDVAKASSMLYLTNFVYIMNQSNKQALIVPFQRENQTSQKLVAGKTYFALLPNKEERVKSGSKVTVVLGGSRAENLVVN
jgi:hypothetical protein